MEMSGEAEPLPGRVQSTGRKHRFSATGKTRQIPAEEETGSWDPYHHPWSGVVAKTPRWGLRVLWAVEFAG